ncbi:hypothetical protein NDU88_004941 [Pleurodeles waltl]|uniref:Uncharacterized protein n=1 Tax=Pleurodeles waltl TaxID=8319 RepID=A0AAV7PH71_PLEWA|nr:hypothetical protein NDU88_004941 [Pleurodeles waltl]
MPDSGEGHVMACEQFCEHLVMVSDVFLFLSYEWLAPRGSIAKGDGEFSGRHDGILFIYGSIFMMKKDLKINLNFKLARIILK